MHTLAPVCWCFCGRLVIFIFVLSLTLSLPTRLYCWWKFCSGTASQRHFAGLQCAFRKLCSSLECMKSGNWSKRLYDVLRTRRNHFAKNIVWCHSSSEWVSKRSYDVLWTYRNHFVENIIWRHNGSEWVKVPLTTSTPLPPCIWIINNCMTLGSKEVYRGIGSLFFLFCASWKCECIYLM